MHECLSLVVPMWNEEEALPALLAAARDLGNALVHNGTIGRFELVLADDGSTDGTARIADHAASTDPGIRLVRHDRNRGLGAAIRSGFAASTGDVVLYVDADLPIDLRQDAPRLLEALASRDADVVAAFRLNRSEGLRRTVFSALYNGLIRIVLELHVRDVNFAAKLVRRRVLDDVQLESEGSLIDAELLARARRRGWTITQIGLVYLPRTQGMSTLSSWSTIRRIFGELVKLTPAIRGLPPRAEPGASGGR